MQKDSRNLQLAISFHRNGKIADAKKIYNNILANDKSNYEILHLLGLIEYQYKNYHEAIKLIRQSINIVGSDPTIYSSLGDVYQAIHDYGEAINCYKIAINNKPKFIEAINNLGVALSKIKKYQEAVNSFDEVLNINPKYIESLYNKANALKNLRQYDDAIATYKKTILFKPNHIGSMCNYGIILIELNKYKEALYLFDQALLIDKNLIEALINKAFILNQIGENLESKLFFEKALNVSPNYNYLLGKYLHHKLKISDWIDFQENFEKLENKIITDTVVLSPFILNSLFNSLSLIKKATQCYCAQKELTNLSKVNIKFKKNFNKIIKIGYYSSDFYSHATSYLMIELFESHDREKFEIYIFYFGSNILDEMSLRINKNCFKFINVQEKSDIEIAEISRKLEIDIAIDLKGYTKDSRPEIFKYLCAPIQINYLGYPGTLYSNYIDYIIADKVLILEEFKSYYTEKIIYLPNSYQVNDSKRKISNKHFTRKEFNLPETSFIFCCFNNNYKILPSIFEMWMRILQMAKDSVLWLLVDNLAAEKNLICEAELRGIDSRRLIFAKRMKLDEHLARHKLADLFLDTFPYNAHTTASDALWAGLPLLTMTGESFASRVAASLLTSLEMTELITNSQMEYEVLAVELATNPQKLQSIKKKLEVNRKKSSLFDGSVFTKNLENAYTQIYARYQAGLAPDHIEVKPQETY